MTTFCEIVVVLCFWSQSLVTFQLTLVHFSLVRFGLLSGHLTRLTICFLCILTICIISNFPFGFEGWIWVLVASVPDLCIMFTVFEVI